LQQRGLTSSRGRKVGDPAGGMSWLNELECARTATWACQAARDIIAAVITMLPQDPKMPIISHFHYWLTQI